VPIDNEHFGSLHLENNFLPFGLNVLLEIPAKVIVHLLIPLSREIGISKI
jgi:hypothetical protein